jgi:large subunit ribosomal protein L35
MPKLKTHKGIKKRFKVSATGKVSHKRCGSSHLNSHKSGNKIRKLRKRSFLTVAAETKRVRKAIRQRISTNPLAVEAARAEYQAENQAAGTTPPKSRRLRFRGRRAQEQQAAAS